MVLGKENGYFVKIAIKMLFVSLKPAVRILAQMITVMSECTLVRECREELGVTVKVGALVRELPFRTDVEYFFACEFISGQLGTGNGPEYQANSLYIGTFHPCTIPRLDVRKLAILPEEVKDFVNEVFCSPAV